MNVTEQYPYDYDDGGFKGGIEKIRRRRLSDREEHLFYEHKGRGVKRNNRYNPDCFGMMPIDPALQFPHLSALREMLTPEGKNLLTGFIVGEGPEYVASATTRDFPVPQILEEAHNPSGGLALSLTIGRAFERLVSTWIDQDRRDSQSEDIYLKSKTSFRLLKFFHDHSIINFIPDNADVLTKPNQLVIQSIHEYKVDPYHSPDLFTQIRDMEDFFNRYAGRKVILPYLYDIEPMNHLRANYVAVAREANIMLVIPPHHRNFRVNNPMARITYTPFSVNFTADVARRSLLDIFGNK